MLILVYIKNTAPEMVANDSPDVLIVGTAVRIFMISPVSKKWLRKLKGQLNKNKKSIKYGISFVTHVLDFDKIKNKGNRFNESLKKGNVIANVYPEWIDGQVKTAEGPFKEGVIERIEKECKEISKWIKS